MKKDVLGKAGLTFVSVVEHGDNYGTVAALAVVSQYKDYSSLYL